MTMCKHITIGKVSLPCVSEADYLDAVESNLGWCTTCQEFTTSCVEPDAERYKCELCDSPTVYGAEQALLLSLMTFGGDDPNEVINKE
jgi:hypothetical protein